MLSSVRLNLDYFFRVRQIIYLILTRLLPPFNSPYPTYDPPRHNPLHPPLHLPPTSNHNYHHLPTTTTHPSTPTRKLNSMAIKHARHPKPNGRPLRPRRLYPPLYPLHHLHPHSLTPTPKRPTTTHDIHDNINHSPPLPPPVYPHASRGVDSSFDSYPRPIHGPGTQISLVNRRFPEHDSIAKEGPTV